MTTSNLWLRSIATIALTMCVLGCGGEQAPAPSTPASKLLAAFQSVNAQVRSLESRHVIFTPEIVGRLAQPITDAVPAYQQEMQDWAALDADYRAKESGYIASAALEAKQLQSQLEIWSPGSTSNYDAMCTVDGQPQWLLPFCNANCAAQNTICVTGCNTLFPPPPPPAPPPPANVACIAVCTTNNALCLAACAATCPA